jgi:hypothetical protein
MKRLVIAGAVLALVCAAGGSAARPSVKEIAATRERAAEREATALLRLFVVPRQATRLRHAPPLRENSWPGSAPTAKFATHTAYWRTRAPLDTVAAFVRAHRPHGMANEPMGSGPRFRLLGYAANETRYLDVTLLRHEGRTFVRVQADVVWVYPRSPREKVPSAALEVDLRAPHVHRRVTDPAKVRQIVRWFDALPISPPGVVIMCPAVAGPKFEFVFRSESRTRLAGASAPSAKAWICNSIGFTLHGKQQTPLVDLRHGRGFVDRVGTLLGLKLATTRS